MKKILTVTSRILKDSKTSIISAIIVALAFGTLSVLFFPTIKESGADLEQVMKAIPAELAKAFNMTSSDFTNFENYIGTRYLGLVGVIIFVIFILIWAGRFAGEAEKGTLALMLAQPIKRAQLLSAHLLSIFALSFILTAITILSIVLPAFLMRIDFDLLNWLKYACFLMLTLFSFGSVSLAIGVIVLNKSKAIALSGGLFFASYILDLFAKLVPDLDGLKYFSLLYYYGDPVKILRFGDFEPLNITVLALTCLFACLVCFLVFRSRDLPAG